jgi:hypothetical protein
MNGTDLIRTRSEQTAVTINHGRLAIDNSLKKAVCHHSISSHTGSAAKVGNNTTDKRRMNKKSESTAHFRLLVFCAGY